MAVPPSGIITLLKVHRELDSDNYAGFPDPTSPSPDTYPNSFGNAPGPAFNNTSLETISTSPTINDNNAPANKPNETAPHHLSEWYSYNGDEPSGTPPPGPRGGPCFTEDTLITLADGTKKRIEEIEIGDDVRVVSGNWPEPHPTGSSWTRMNTFLWNGSDSWNAPVTDSNIVFTSSQVNQIDSQSFTEYEQYELNKVDPSKNSWEDGYTIEYKTIKSSFGHPFLIKPKYSDGRSGTRNDTDDGYLCFKTSNKIGRGDQMYISGSGFLPVTKKKWVTEDTTMYTFRCEENYVWIANDIVVRET